MRKRVWSLSSDPAAAVGINVCIGNAQGKRWLSRGKGREINTYQGWDDLHRFEIFRVDLRQIT